MITAARKYLLFGLCLAGSLLADQGTKMWARRALASRMPPELTVIPNWWELRYSENTGSAFGLFRNLPGSFYLLSAVGLIALGFIVYQLTRPESSTRLAAVCLGLIAGGALGNIIDRLVFGKVTDFIVWFFVTTNDAGVSRRHEWYVFNVADAALVVGVLVFLVFGSRKPAAEAAKGRAA